MQGYAEEINFKVFEWKIINNSTLTIRPQSTTWMKGSTYKDGVSLGFIVLPNIYCL